MCSVLQKGTRPATAMVLMILGLAALPSPGHAGPPATPAPVIRVAYVTGMR